MFTANICTACFPRHFSAIPLQKVWNIVPGAVSIFQICRMPLADAVYERKVREIANILVTLFFKVLLLLLIADCCSVIPSLPTACNLMDIISPSCLPVTASLSCCKLIPQWKRLTILHLIVFVSIRVFPNGSYLLLYVPNVLALALLLAYPVRSLVLFQ